MKTYLFYDTETSGLNPAFDQILTFACIRTDLYLNEIDRQAFTIRLRKDIVPSAKAFLTHGLTLRELALGLREYEAAIQIHKILNTPQTISVGYNSLGFDDEFLRFMFYRNLLEPYTHQYSNGCYRMDVLPVTVVFKVFHPAGINWPHIDGKPSLRLDLISRENNITASGKAHEAMYDVETLIGLSRKLIQQNDIWNYCMDFFNKTRDEVRINSIKKEFSVHDRIFRLCIMVSVSFGAKVNFMAPVVDLGQSLPYKNQTLWLRLDLDDILDFNSDVELKDTYVIRKRPGDALIVLPALERFWNRIPAASRHAAGENMKKICLHWERFFEFLQYHIEYEYPFIPDIDPDAALYQEGFFTAQEKKQCDLFHMTPDHQKPIILNQIQSPRIKILANRILARNFEELSEGKEKTEYHLHLNKLKSSLEGDQIKGYKNDIKLNRKQGLQELREMEQGLLVLDPDQRKVLEGLRIYMETL